MFIKIDNLKILISAGSVLIIVFSAFLPCLENGFTNFDDDKYVTDNPVVQSMSLINLNKAFTSFFCGGHYQPITIISFLIDYRFFKLNPFGYHLNNFILHLINCLLVFWMIFILTGRISVSWLTAVFFGIHPLQVESVAWISERKNLLYTLFFLGSVISYCYYFLGGSRVKYYIILIFLFILSLLSKAMAVTLPLALFLIDYFLARKSGKKVFIEKIPLFILSLIFGIAVIFGVYVSGANRQEGAFSLAHRLITASYGCGFYLNKLFFPFRLSALYPYPEVKSLLHYLQPVIAIGILIAAVIISGRYTKKIIFGAGFFLVNILPALQFIPNGEIIVADRYAYLPAIGIFFIIAVGLAWLFKQKIKCNILARIFILIILIWVIANLSALTGKRCKVWKDSITLWDNVLENDPNSVTAYVSRGIAYKDIGSLKQAMSDFNKAVAINPYYFRAYINRGNIYLEKNDFNRAVLDYSKAIEINPFNSLAYYNRGRAYQLSGNLDLAISEYNKSIEINPDYAVAYNNRAIAYFGKREFDKSRKDVYKAESLGYKVIPLEN